MDYLLRKDASSKSPSLAAGQLMNTAAASFRFTDLGGIMLLFLLPTYFSNCKALHSLINDQESF